MFAISLYYFETLWPAPVAAAEYVLVLALFFEGVKPILPKANVWIHSFTAASFAFSYWAAAGYCRPTVYKKLASVAAQVPAQSDASSRQTSDARVRHSPSHAAHTHPLNPDHHRTCQSQVVGAAAKAACVEKGAVVGSYMQTAGSASRAFVVEHQSALVKALCVLGGYTVGVYHHLLFYRF